MRLRSFSAMCADTNGTFFANIRTQKDAKVAIARISKKSGIATAGITVIAEADRAKVTANAGTSTVVQKPVRPVLRMEKADAVLHRVPVVDAITTRKSHKEKKMSRRGVCDHCYEKMRNIRKLILVYLWRWPGKNFEDIQGQDWCRGYDRALDAIMSLVKDGEVTNSTDGFFLTEKAKTRMSKELIMFYAVPGRWTYEDMIRCIGRSNLESLEKTFQNLKSKGIIAVNVRGVISLCKKSK